MGYSKAFNDLSQSKNENTESEKEIDLTNQSSNIDSQNKANTGQDS